MNRRKAPRPRFQAYDRGLWAERLAALMLGLKGYRILGRRYQTPVGEIDLIVRKGEILAFVEVKYRKNTAQALAALTPRQRDRVGRAAQLFVSARPDLAHLDQRFDVVLVTIEKLMQHIKNYWQPSLK